MLKSGADQAADDQQIELLADGQGRALPTDEIRKMTLRIEKSSDGGKTLLRLTGRIRREHLEDLRAQIGTFKAPTAIDMESVTLVDVDVVRFLGIIELQGIEVLHCSPYIREWIRREIEETRP